MRAFSVTAMSWSVNWSVLVGKLVVHEISLRSMNSP